MRLCMRYFLKKFYQIWLNINNIMPEMEVKLSTGKLRICQMASRLSLYFECVVFWNIFFVDRWLIIQKRLPFFFRFLFLFFLIFLRCGKNINLSNICCSLNKKILKFSPSREFSISKCQRSRVTFRFLTNLSPSSLYIC